MALENKRIRKPSVWNDPFGIDALQAVNSAPIIIDPYPARATDVGFIREQQKALLPVLDHMLEAAHEITDVPYRLAQIKAESIVRVKVIYRYPDAEHVINRNSFSHEMDDVAVAIPVYGESARKIPAIDMLFPIQELQRIVDPTVVMPKDTLKAIIRLTEEQADEEGIPQKQRVVFPNMLRFLHGWINTIDGLIYDVGYNVGRPDYRAANYVAYDSKGLN